MATIDRLKANVLDALTPTAAVVFTADPNSLPPLVLCAKCATWLEWLTERLQLERYKCVATRPTPLGHQAETHLVFSVEPDNSDEIVDQLIELGRTGTLQADAKRQIIVRNLHKMGASAQSRLKHALDLCQMQCAIVFTSSHAMNMHGRCTIVNCNPPKARWRAMLAPAGGGDLERVLSDPRSDSLIAAALLLDAARSPRDVLADHFGSAVEKLRRPGVTPLQAHAMVRQVAKVACQYRLTLANVVCVLTRSDCLRDAPWLAEAVVQAGRLAPDTTSRHTLLCVETLLWRIYALGHGSSPAL